MAAARRSRQPVALVCANKEVSMTLELAVAPDAHVAAERSLVARLGCTSLSLSRRRHRRGALAGGGPIAGFSRGPEARRFARPPGHVLAGVRR
jgi:hypothetical protein